MSATPDQLARFAASHAGPGLILLPNAWNAGSAALMAAAGFEFIATTSAGIAHAAGVPDGSLGRDEMLAQVEHIVQAVSLPVTADLEDGYGPRAEDVAATVAAAIGIGLAGCNLEDSDLGGDPTLIDLERMCDRIRAAREAVTRAGVPFVLNARTDPYLVRRDAGDTGVNFNEAVRRARAYANAGADCVYVPGIMDAPTVGRLVASIDAPLNVLGARGGREADWTVADLERVGVRRISVGGSLALAATGFLRDALRGMRQGFFNFGQGAHSNAEMDELLTINASGSLPRD